MATEREANIAREKFSDELRSMGAHAIAVDEVEHKGKKTFAVLAFFQDDVANLKESLDIRVGNKTVNVPLLPKKTDRFKLQ